MIIRELPIKVWVTKNALTNSIMEVDAELCSDTMIRWTDDGYVCYAHGKGWHITLESAIERAEEMRQAKIVSLHKKIKKLEELKFDVRMICAK